MKRDLPPLVREKALATANALRGGVPIEKKIFKNSIYVLWLHALMWKMKNKGIRNVGGASEQLIAPLNAKKPTGKCMVQ